MTKVLPDILTTNHGTIITIEGHSSRGIDWLRENVDPPSACVDCEHRYAIDILIGALHADLTLQDTTTKDIATPDALQRIER